MKWSYALNVGEKIISISFGREEESGEEDIGAIDSTGAPSVYHQYGGHMTIQKQNESATLTILRVNASDETKYFCKIRTNKGYKKDFTFLVILGE